MQAPLLEEHFELAALNGITRVLLHSRYYQRNWSLERATTEPVNKKTPSEHTSYIDVAQAHSISRATYFKRVGEGWTKEDACTVPTQGLGRRRTRIYTDEQLEIANQHGISRQMLDRRLARGWHLERALTANHCEEWIRNHGERAELFVSKKQRAPKKARGSNKYTKDQLRIALSNGIRLYTLQARLQRGWDIERAITEPTHNRERKEAYV